MKLSKSFKSFTLIELLIVIVIIGILATALIPRLTGVQAKSRDMARIAHMRQMQQALEMYNNENGGYPGNGHYGESIGCNHVGGSPLWTSVFDANFTKNYISGLPSDPKGNSTLYCYGYTKLNTTAGHCTKKDGTIIDVDGKDQSGNVTGPQGNYVLTFVGETDLSDSYPLWNIQPSGGNVKRYCILP